MIETAGATRPFSFAWPGCAMPGRLR